MENSNGGLIDEQRITDADRYLIMTIAHNLGRLMHALFGIGTPRGLQKFVDQLAEAFALDIKGVRNSS